MLTPDTISPSSNEVLQALLNAHGLEARISGGLVVVIGHQAQWSGAVYFQPENEVAHLQLDVNLHLPDGRTLVESFSGLGTSHKFALGDAFDNFSRASFHVLLQAFFGVPGKEPQTWQLPMGSFHVFLGDVTVRGHPPVEGEELVRWIEPFLQVLQRAPLSQKQAHWIRLYYAQHEGSDGGGELLLDNEPWQPLQNSILHLPWPQGHDFYSQRLFLVLLPLRGCVYGDFPYAQCSGV